MPFEKGNNLGGRKKGSLNKCTQNIRESFAKLLEGNLGQLEEDFEALEPKDRIKMFIELSKYVVPTLKSTEIKGNPEKPINILPIEWVE